MHRTTQRFWRCFEELPYAVQQVARKNFSLLKNNPSHPSLQFKPVGKFWSARVGADHRALARKDGSDFIWVWIGTHAEYNHLIG